MSGGGGHVILHAVRQTLTNPLVHGQLPPDTKILVDAIFDKDDADWSDYDKHVIAEAIRWALLNCK